MTGLPHATIAEIDRRKITDYLLSINHPAGRAKAAFFYQFGFLAAAWRNFRDALVQHACSATTVSVVETPYGRKYILDGVLPAPDGRRPRIRMVWFVASDKTRPRLVTAYPLPGDTG